MLKIVEQQEHALVTQRLAQYVERRALRMLAQIQRAQERIGHQIRISDRRQRNEVDAIGEFGSQFTCRSQAQAGLAHAARPVERQQPHVGAAQALSDRLDVRLPTDEVSQSGR